MISIGIVGAGSIGSSFALLFADAGYQVRVFDPDPSAMDRSQSLLLDRTLQLDSHDLLRSSPHRVRSLIEYVSTVAQAVDGADLVQEAGPEDLAAKKKIFSQLSQATTEDTVLASSSSAIPSSRFLAEDSAARTLLAHPGNPPYLLRVIEVVGNPRTSDETLEKAEDVYSYAGLTPVRVHKEIDGFVFNRIQGAVLREAFALVGDGVVDPDGLDTLVRDGLGLRWSVLGPFATSDLNVRGGIRAHARRMSDAYQRMAAQRDQEDVWTTEALDEVDTARRRAVPLEKWDEAVAERDVRLMQLMRERR